MHRFSSHFGLGRRGRSSSVGSSPSIGRRKSPAPTTTELRTLERPCVLVLLDDRRLEVPIKSGVYTKDLLDMITSHLGIDEKEYFGLAFVNEQKRFTWLQADRRVLDHHDLPTKSGQLTLYFLVQHYPESISNLTENKTIELLYLHVRRLVAQGAFQPELDLLCSLVALSLQAFHGDCVNDLVTRILISKCPFIPAAIAYDLDKVNTVIRHYRRLNGQTRGQAIVRYMSLVETLPTYGVHFFDVVDQRQVAWQLGLSCRGIAVYKAGNRDEPRVLHGWSTLDSLYFQDCKFCVEVLNAKGFQQPLAGLNDSRFAAATLPRRRQRPRNVHSWFSETSGQSRALWQCAKAHHGVYLKLQQQKALVRKRTLKEIAQNLATSSTSLSSTSSLVSNLSRTESGVSKASSSRGSISKSSQELSVAGAKEENSSEIYARLQARRDSVEKRLRVKEALLAELCFKEEQLIEERARTTSASSVQA